jgi:RimJ/RimL family protein N-acetyltransferase
VEETHTGQLVGSVGAFFREESTMLELGWNTYRAFSGRGYANEAAAAALQHAFEIRREPKVQALIVPSNASSLRVAQRLGLRYEGESVLAGAAIGSYTLERENRIA